MSRSVAAGREQSGGDELVGFLEQPLVVALGDLGGDVGEGDPGSREGQDLRDSAAHVAGPDDGDVTSGHLLACPSEGSFIGVDCVHLGRGCGGVVEAVAQPFADELLGQFQADDALAHGQHLGVVGQHGAFHGVAVVRGDGSDAGDFVGRDGHAQSGAADQQGPVGLAGGDLAGRGDGQVRVGGAVVRADADVLHGRDPGVRLEQFAQGVLVFDAGLVVADDDPPAGLGVGAVTLCLV